MIFVEIFLWGVGGYLCSQVEPTSQGINIVACFVVAGLLQAERMRRKYDKKQD